MTSGAVCVDMNSKALLVLSSYVHSSGSLRFGTDPKSNNMRIKISRVLDNRAGDDAKVSLGQNLHQSDPASAANSALDRCVRSRSQSY